MENSQMPTPVQQAQRLGQLIRETRHTRKLSLRLLSTQSGIPRSTIDRIEKGEIARPRPDILTALGHALAIPLADLYSIVHYAAPHDLPSFAPYLRARYGDLRAETLTELTGYFETLAAREGVRLDGPPHLEDEAQ